MARLVALNSKETSHQPTLVIIESTMALESMPTGLQTSETQRQSGSSLHFSTNRVVPLVSSPDATLQDNNLLRSITSHISTAKAPTLIIPLAFVELPENVPHVDGRRAPGRDMSFVPPETLRCIDDGAAHVIFGPLARDSICSIACQAYRLLTDTKRHRASIQDGIKARKRSWVGTDDRKPYAYLREEMYVPFSEAETLPCTRRY